MCQILGDGEEIKLQRNALQILEHPTGNEADFSEEEEEEEAAPSQAASHYSHLPQHQPRVPLPLPHTEGASPQRRSSSRTAAIPRINLNKLDINALRRYRTLHGLPGIGPHTSKDQLVVAVAEHLSAQTMDEMAVLEKFRERAKRYKAL
uniref:Histone deacetylase complex subunit SAP30 Sin3 binding domain-containing protein n=1 Tax=Auxenochlorella protothecoides TaxID=3075 RepID=A0A1D1ZYQ0_AUXPR